jgi:uncharacterized protein (DUF58 family)
MRAALLLVASAALWLVAQTMDWPEVRLAGGALTVLMVVNLIWAQLSLRGLRVTRRLDTDRVQVGHSLRDTVEVHNDGQLGKLWVELVDHSSLPGHNASRVFSIRRKSRTSWTVETTVLQRGRHAVGPVQLRSSDLFGTFSKSRDLRETVEVVAYPYLFDLAGYAPPSALQSGGQTRHVRSTAPTPTVGGARDYVHGDPINRISWSITARTGRLMVKEFETDPTADVWIVLDVNMRPPRGTVAVLPLNPEPTDFLTTPFELAVSVAASVLRRSLDTGRAVGLMTVAGEPLVLSPERSDRQYVRSLEWLATIEPRPGFDLLAMLTTQGGRFRRDASAVLLTQHGAAHLAAYLASLRERRVYSDVIVVDGASFGEDEDATSLVEELRSMLVPARAIGRDGDVAAALRSPHGTAMPASAPVDYPSSYARLA